MTMHVPSGKLELIHKDEFDTQLLKKTIFVDESLGRVEQDE